MHFLIISESSPSSANYNIAVRLAYELKKNHKVYFGYFPPSSFTMKTVGVDGELEWIDDKLEKEYEKIKSNQWKRIIYFFKHPVYFISKLLDRGKLSELSRRIVFMNRASKYCEKNEIDVVIGVTEPYITARIVSGLRIRSEKYIIQLDPYAYNQSTVNGNDELFRKRIKEESIVFQRINRLFTTSLIKKDLVRSAIFRNREKDIIEIEFPLIDAEKKDEIPAKKRIISKNDGEIAFLHCGSLYNDIRNPKNLVSLFEKLPDEYILYVAGNNSESIREYDSNIRNRIIDLGVLSLEDAALARVEADILISYNNLVDNQVPSKLFECINEGKPFINLCQIPNCPTLPYVEGYDMAYSVFSFAIEEKIDGLKRFVKEMIGKHVGRSYIMNKFKKCTIEYFAETIVDR